MAIIMDGNGRWAQQRGLPRLEGHHAGVENTRRVVEFFADQGVPYLTLYAFSTENWNRPQHEVQGLIQILQEMADDQIHALHQRGVRILHLGRKDRLPPRLQQLVAYSQELTQKNTRLTLCLAFDYGGRAEILEAVQRILRDGVAPEDLDEALFSRYLYTAGLPEPDLIIRTGGEQRLSNFLLWQSAYSEYYSAATLWPDFDEEEASKALEAYRQRERRFGTVDPER
ncbi:MAG: polyprenyl diphosphate synthase [Dehalococcoidia bacterium]